MSFTPEQHDAFDTYIMDLVKDGEFSDKSQREMARELLKVLDDEGNPVFWNTDSNEIYSERTLRQHVTKFIKNAQSNAFANDVAKNLMEQAFVASKDVSTKPQMMKVLADKFMPDKRDSADDKQHSPIAIAILNRERVEITDGSGQVICIEGTGDSGHERPYTVHPVASGRGEDTPIKALPLADDSVVHGLHQGQDTAEGNTVPDTEIPSQDTVDNDSGGGLDPPE